jgi:hypothetical protein
MAVDTERGALFRPFVPNQHSRVTYAELFFDLVFVFAVTQVSHTLLGHFTPFGALQTTLLFLGVWWVWVYTSWITNWLNPELTPVRILLFSCSRPRFQKPSNRGGYGSLRPTRQCRSVGRSFCWYRHHLAELWRA